MEGKALVLGSSGGQGHDSRVKWRARPLVLGSSGGQGHDSRVKWRARPWFYRQVEGKAMVLGSSGGHHRGSFGPSTSPYLSFLNRDKRRDSFSP